jgi:hypothetical protein
MCDPKDASGKSGPASPRIEGRQRCDRGGRCGQKLVQCKLLHWTEPRTAAGLPDEFLHRLTCAKKALDKTVVLPWTGGAPNEYRNSHREDRWDS